MSRTWIVPIGALIALSLITGCVVQKADTASNVGSGSLEISVPDPEIIYDPTRDGSELPDGFRQVLRRDQIEPIYHPEFADADAVDWPDESLILGVVGEATAKAYPITHLNQHEMVLDEIEGLPILVSW